MRHKDVAMTCDAVAKSDRTATKRPMQRRKPGLCACVDAREDIHFQRKFTWQYYTPRRSNFDIISITYFLVSCSEPEKEIEENRSPLFTRTCRRCILSSPHLLFVSRRWKRSLCKLRREFERKEVHYVSNFDHMEGGRETLRRRGHHTRFSSRRWWTLPENSTISWIGFSC